MKKINIKRTTHLFWMAFVVVLPLLGACQKEEEMDEDGLRCPVTAVDGADDDIIGKWKLVKAHQEFSFPPQEPQDYSCDNVIYHFKEDGILTVSGVREGMISRRNGDYPFEFNVIKGTEEVDGRLTVRFGNFTYSFRIEDNKIVLSSASLDGPIRHFIRVE